MPSSPNYVRDLKQELKTANARGDKKRRAKRNAARAKMVKAGKAHKGDNLDVDHKAGTKAGNGMSNLRMQSKSKNRSNGGKAKSPGKAMKGKKAVPKKKTIKKVSRVETHKKAKARVIKKGTSIVGNKPPKKRKRKAVTITKSGARKVRF